MFICPLQLRITEASYFYPVGAVSSKSEYVPANEPNHAVAIIGWCGSWGTGTTSKAANVFEAKSNGEVLKEIGFYTTENGANVKVSVYTYAQDPRNNENNIEKGTRASTN